MLKSNSNPILKLDSTGVCMDFYRQLIITEQNTVVIGLVGMTSLQVNCSLAEVNASVFIAVF